MAVTLTTTGKMAESSGVKAIIYGGAGCGKTPLLLTAPNPVYIAIERGQVSLQGSNVPAVEAFTLPQFYAVMEWLDKSEEAKKFDTIYVDSISALAQLILDEELSKTSKSGAKVNGEAAYGEMAQRTMKALTFFNGIPQKNVVLLAQMDITSEKPRPLFAGKNIYTRIPHLFDCVWHLGLHDVPNKGMTYSLQCRETPEIFARTRFNHCADFEPPKLDYLFNKLMNGVK